MEQQDTNLGFQFKQNNVPNLPQLKEEEKKPFTFKQNPTENLNGGFSFKQNEAGIETKPDQVVSSQYQEDKVLNNPKDDQEDTTMFGSIVGDVGDFITSGEIITAPLEGIAKGVGEVGQFLDETGEALEDKLNIGRLIFKDNPDSFLPTIEYWSRDKVREKGLKDSLVNGVIKTADAAEEAIPDTDTVTGVFVEALSQFGTGFILSRRATGIGGIKGTLVNSAIADATAFDPFEENISAFLKQNGYMKNIFVDALANDDDESAFKNRLKNAGEGLIVGGAFEGIAAAYRAARATRKAKEEVILNGEVSEETAKEFDAAADNIEAMAAKLQAEADNWKAGNTDAIDSKPEEEVVKQERIKHTKKYDIEAAKANTAQAIQETKELARKTAEQNQDIAREMIENFERKLLQDPDITTNKISKEVNGKLIIDPDLARQVSQEKINSIADVKQRKITDVIFKEEKNIEEVDYLGLAMSEGDSFSAILKPEKFDAIVSIASKYKNDFGSEWDKAGDTIIDKLFNLTVDKKLIGGEQLLTDLAKYGLNFEDYVMTVVGSGSEAGRILNKLSQIKRSRPLTSAEEAKQKALLKEQDRIRSTFMRIENVRRGMMVSQVATAARNLQSGLVRAPLEGLGKVMDDALYNFGEGGFAGFGRTIISGDTWRGAFRHTDTMFRNQKAAKEYTRFFLEQPELVDRLDTFYNQMSDMQINMGRGQATSKAGKVVDFFVSKGEDVSHILNTPNRWQEFMLRNSMFLSDMERLVKREWNIDLIDEINKGNIRDIMSDSGRFKPEGARSIIDIADESIYNALDLTYANNPDLKVFRDLNNFIVRNGLTTVLPFPRFMFKSMELLGKYGAGASIPLTRMAMKAVSGVRGKDLRTMSRQERDLIGKNIQGLPLIGAGIWYRLQEDAPAEYQYMNADEGYTLDTSAIFPLRPILLIGEMVKQAMQGTLERWTERNPREIVEVLTGTNFRVGPSNFLLNDIVSNVFGDSEINESTARQAGGALGNYFSTFLVPYGQLIDSARALGLANNEYKDSASEPSLDNTNMFFDNFIRPFSSRYDPSADKPNREFVLKDESDRKRIGAKVIAGLNFHGVDADYARYLKQRGFSEFSLGSNSRSPQQRRDENVYIRQYLKAEVPVLQEAEERFKQQWELLEKDAKEGLTFERALESRVLKPFEANLRKIKTRLRKSSGAELDEEVRAYLELNKLSRSAKRKGIAEYQILTGEIPDMTDPLTVRKVAKLGQKMK